MGGWPHDDTASLTAFYGRPGTPSNMVLVKPPWQMTYEGRPIKGVQIHRKCADSLVRVFNDIAGQVGHDWSKLPDGAVKFSGSYNYRPIRGSSRPSCHAFGAAIDMDAEGNPMNTNGDQGTMSPIVIDAFKREGWYWGGDFHSRQDPMHFQAANEGQQVADNELIDPPMADGHDNQEASIVPTLASFVTADSVGTITTVAKPLVKSHIAWGTAGLGATSVATTIANAPPTASEQILHALKSPFLWLIALNIALVGFVLYHYWRDHGKGSVQ